MSYSRALLISDMALVSSYYGLSLRVSLAMYAADLSRRGIVVRFLMQMDSSSQNIVLVE